MNQRFPSRPHPLDSLLKYDPQVIQSYYRYRFWSVISRLIWVFWAFGIFILGLRWESRRHQGHSRSAARLRKLLTELGPTFIKVGQALSTRPDLVRKDFLEELVKLQDQLPPFPTPLALDRIEAALGKPPQAIFAQISSTPVAAASLGQVYKARLYAGQEVAVKVQRPNLLPTLTLDLYLMRWAARHLGRWLPVNLGHDLVMIVDEFGTKLFEEIDYENEGRNAERFAANFRDNPSVKVPEIYWPYTSRQVLTLEWIDGIKLINLEEVRAANLDNDALIRIGVTCGLQQLLEFGFFHADPHPGNLFALRDGRMGYIDFGMMDQLDQVTKETLVDSVVHLINREYTDLALAFVKLGFLTPETDIAPIVPALEAVLGDVVDQAVGHFNFKTITDRFSELMYEYPFRVPAQFALIIRSLVTQEGIALTLNPQFKILDVAYPYVARRLLTGESPSLRRRLFEVLFKDGRLQWARLENLIAIARADQGFDLLPTAQLGLEYLMSEEGHYLRTQILLALTEDDRLHTTEVQRLWDLIKHDLPPRRLMNAAWDTLADFSRERAAQVLAPLGLG